MYPAEGPPPRRFLTYVTIQPRQQPRLSTERVRQGYRKLTSQRHLYTDVDEDKDRHEVERLQPEHLPVLAPLVFLRPVLMMRDILADFRESRCNTQRAPRLQVSVRYQLFVGSNTDCLDL